MTHRAGAWLILGALFLAWSNPHPAEAARHVIEIRNMAFAAPPAGLKAGDTILWKNTDMFRHTATDRKGSFDLDLEPGAQGETRLRNSGPLEVFCRYHPNMVLHLMVGKVR
ncbi:MAG: amicyanin [Alphaproteobacteria bacterium]|nr:amicyanin [Alphaproteobacteria bacterium]